MNYLSQMIGMPVMDAAGEKIGTVNDVGVATREVFPRITSLAFQGPSKTPFMISWRKYVESITDGQVTLSVPAQDIRFSYLQPTELLLARDLMNKQIVDTQGLKVVRVNDLKLSLTGENQLRLLGAEVGVLGLIRGLSPKLATGIGKVTKLFGKEVSERIIAWNYMDLLDRDLSQVQLSVTHKRLDDIHPADVADIIEQLDPRLRAQVFAQLETEQAAETISELEDEFQAEVLDEMSDRKTSDIIAQMDPDDAADLVAELGPEKAERILQLMGIEDEHAIRVLLGYKERTAGGLMTNEFVALNEDQTVADAVERLRGLDDDHESVHYIYTVDNDDVLTGVLSLRTLVLGQPTDILTDLSFNELRYVHPELDQEDVAEEMSKYDLVSVPVVDEEHKLLGIVTVDDVLDVMEEEHLEDLQLAGGGSGERGEYTNYLSWLLRRESWYAIWIVATAVLSACMPGSFGIYLAAFMPIVLLVANDMTNYATIFFLEHDDEEDEVAATTLILRNLGTGLVASLLVLLLGLLFIWTDINVASINTQFLGRALGSAAITILITILGTRIYMNYISYRDEADKQTSGTTMALIAMVLAVIVFSLLGYASILVLPLA